MEKYILSYDDDMDTDLAPFAGTVGCGFMVGLITGYAIKKVFKLAVVIVGLFFAGLAYLEYQRILNVDWHKVQSISQNGMDWVADALTHVSNTEGCIFILQLWYTYLSVVARLQPVYFQLQFNLFRL